MKRPSNYNTRQREAILSFIASIGGSHVTAAKIIEHLLSEDVTISRTTVYRHLDKLTESGHVRKYTIDGVTGACYQYVDGANNCPTHFHLKCEECGELLHLNCDALDEIQRHINDEHAFQINNMRTILYGRCNSCR